jgi:hypothetical protein
MASTLDTPPSAWLELADKTTQPLDRDCSIGRVTGNEIVIPEHRISRRHAVVQRQGNRFVVVDLGSTNGTFVNDTRIFRPTVLHDADVITVGAQRFLFCQPIVSAGDADDAFGSTAVVVSKTPCWMLLVAIGPSSGAAGPEWAAKARQAATRGGGTIKQLTGGSLLVHWRADVAPVAAVKAVIESLASLPPPKDARLLLHYGLVRVGAGATPVEENLLGADVTFTYKLETVAAQLGVDFLLSDAAVKSLGLSSSATSMGLQSVRDMPGTHEVFAWAK